jgi:hypothetical protein
MFSFLNFGTAILDGVQIQQTVQFGNSEFKMAVPVWLKKFTFTKKKIKNAFECFLDRLNTLISYEISN